MTTIWNTRTFQTAVTSVSNDMMSVQLELPQQESPKISLSSLPLHVVALILEHLDAVDHLPAAVLSHRIFYAALHDLPTLTSDLLRAQVRDDEIFVLALVAQASRPDQRATRRISAHDLLLTWRDDPSRLVAPYRNVKVPEALRIGELHGIVTDFRKDFVQHTAGKLYRLEDGQELSAEQARLGPAEIRRIDRAIYRFQIYVNLFADRFQEGEEDAELKRLFFERNSAWVNEQLGCFYDYLEAKLDQVIENIVARNPDRACWLNDGQKEGRRQAYLCLGLPWLRRLLLNKDAEAQYTLLQSSKDTFKPRRPTHLELPTNFRQRQRSVWPHEGPDWNLDIESLVREADTDDGPRRVWTETRRGGGADVFSVVDHDRALRRLGYVLWDNARFSNELVSESIAAATADATPTFASPGRLLNVVRSRDKPVPRTHQQQPGLSARERRAARKRNTVNV